MIKNDFYVDIYDTKHLEAIKIHYFNKKIYLSILMSVSYAAARCRPDILKETAFLSTLTHNLTLSCWKRLFKVCGYLISNPILDIIFSDGSLKSPAQAYTDASFLVHRNTNGHTGIILKLYGNTVLQKSIKQRLVTKSVMEAELLALEEGLTYALFLGNLMQDLGLPLKVPIQIFSDNEAAILVAKKGRGSFKRTKHFLNKYHWIKQFIDDKTVELIHVRSENNIADYFTKPIIGVLFWFFLELIVRNHETN